MSEQAYKALIAALAEQAPLASEPRDLPELSHAQLATVLREYPSAFYDALADADPDAAAQMADRLSVRTPKTVEVYQHVGLYIVGVLRSYVKELVLRDLRAQVERNREAGAIEAGHDLQSALLQAALTDDQFIAGEFGLGRLV